MPVPGFQQPKREIHYYLIAGHVFDLSGTVKFKPFDTYKSSSRSTCKWMFPVIFNK
jgi:hypothetical protein